MYNNALLLHEIIYSCLYLSIFAYMLDSERYLGTETLNVPPSALCVEYKSVRACGRLCASSVSRPTSCPTSTGCKVTRYLPCLSFYGEDGCSDCTSRSSYTFLHHLGTWGNRRLQTSRPYRRKTHMLQLIVSGKSILVYGAAYKIEGHWNDAR